MTFYQIVVYNLCAACPILPLRGSLSHRSVLMKVLVLGGTGLISTAITQQLLARGDQVTHFNRGQSPVRFEGHVQTITGNRRDLPAFEAQMAAAGEFDAVIDMICFTPDEAHSAVRAFRGRAGQFIFCSTVDVYLKPPLRFPVTETNTRREGLSEYGRNKAICEDIFMAAHQADDFAVTILRPAHTYGEGGAIIHTFGWQTTFLDRLRRGLPVIVHGDGSSLWASCHVDDVGRAFVHALGNKQASGKSYHTTGDEWQTWDQYHHGITTAMGWPAPTLIHIPTDLLYRIAPDRAGISMFNFQHTNIFDNSASRADLGFVQEVLWQEGVRRTIQSLEANGRIEASETDPGYERIIAAWARLTDHMAAELAQ
jgi:nucleoside-diphosphate-sugar epimerase